MPATTTTQTPVSNTGGNSELPTCDKKPLIIDTLSVTGKFEDFPSTISFTDDDVINELSIMLQRKLGLTPHGDHAGCKNGYKNSRMLAYTDDRPFQNLGFIAWGGNRGSFQLYLTGEACEYLQMTESWVHVHAICEKTNMNIKRLDIALDDYEGKLDLDLAISLYEAGEFRITRNPTIRQVGDFISENDTKGRTIYIGNRDNGKMMRIYEKGKQLGDEQSPWVRWELELKAVDRKIPLDALLDYCEYYAGAYPALANFEVSTAQQVIKTVKKKGEIILKKAIHYGNQHVGGLMNVLKGLFSEEKIIEMLTPEDQTKVPKRLKLPVPVKSKPVTQKIIDHIPLPKDEFERDFYYSLN